MADSTKTPTPVAPQATKTFTIKRPLTVPLVSMAHTPEIAVEALSEIEARTMEGFGKSENSAVDILPCLELTGQVRIDLILGAVMKSAVVRAGHYIGKRFLFRAGTPVAGKRYRAVDVFELE